MLGTKKHAIVPATASFKPAPVRLNDESGYSLTHGGKSPTERRAEPIVDREGTRVTMESSGTVRELFRDSQILIIDKPPAMLSHPHGYDHRSPNVQAVVERKLGRRVYIVHRLDRMTTGIMVIALTQEAARNLSFQFRDRRTVKHYIAIVRGHTDPRGTIERPLEVASGELSASRTSFTTIGRATVATPVGRYPEAWLSLVELELHSGRRHQARRHLHHIDHPVLGDSRHGDKAYNRWAAELCGERHLFLRSTDLTFTHPATGRAATVHVGIPSLWRRLLACPDVEWTVNPELAARTIGRHEDITWR